MDEISLAHQDVVRDYLDRVARASALTAPRYRLTVPVDARRTLAVGWLVLGILALVAAGILSILLVVSRTPLLQSVFPVADFFRVALVAHVDLSVLVWFLAFAGVLWTMNSTPRFIGGGWSAFLLAAAGATAIALAPFLGRGRPVMANYIPVLRDPVFLSGLVAFAAGVAMLVLRGMATAPRVGVRLDGPGALRFGLNASLVSTAIALIAFAWSYAAVPPALDPAAYYEVLFWGGGHVLQFTWTLLMLIAWLALAEATGARVPLSPRIAALLFGVGLTAAFITPAIYLGFEVGSVEHHRLLTWVMQFGGGLAIPPVAIAVLWGVFRHGRIDADRRPMRAALVCSVALFGIGGAIGFLIHGSNVKIPAHYHGSIVGVTIALMGLTYLLLPALGFARPSLRLATMQPYLYGGGQLLHVVGLVWSGGYGVQRKVAGSEQVLRSAQEILGMGLMGLGGFIAVLGGVLFVFVVLHALWRSRGRRSAA